MTDRSDNMLRQLSTIDSLTDLWTLIDTEISQRLRVLKAASAEEALARYSSVVVYGAGDFSRAVLEAWQGRNVPIEFVVDGNRQKWDTTWQGYSVRDPDALRQTTSDCLCVVAAMDSSDIESFLVENKIPHIFAERDGSVGMTAAHLLRQAHVRCEQVYAALADEHSRFVFLSAIIGRVFQRFKCAMRGNFFMDRCATAPQYFPADIFTIRDGETYVDCGVFDGDSLAIFAMEAWRRHIRDWRALGVEADPRNAELARSNLRAHGVGEVEIFEAAVGSGKESISSMHLHNCRGQALATVGSSVSLDELLVGFHPTYMKFDIEGAEIAALRGSQRIIEQCKPKIAVCVYHTTRDLFEIPLFLTERYPFYRIYMRHHKAGSLWETVCYAVPG